MLGEEVPTLLRYHGERRTEDLAVTYLGIYIRYHCVSDRMGTEMTLLPFHFHIVFLHRLVDRVGWAVLGGFWVWMLCGIVLQRRAWSGVFGS